MSERKNEVSECTNDPGFASSPSPSPSELWPPTNKWASNPRNPVGPFWKSMPVIAIMARRPFASSEFSFLAGAGPGFDP